MRFRRLQIKLQTTDGPYGVTLDLPDGLVVVWADNSMGKSTCVKSMLVALGMEAMLGTAQAELPLPPAMKSRLAANNGEHTVLESEIFLEIENAAGARIVVQRTIKGTRDKNLITVHNGPALTSPDSVAGSRDYFVSRQGAATRDSGFHYYLGSFLGWSLPTVQTYDGNESPLYLQCIFPYFVVEQTRGWSTVQPPIPTHFRIREAHKRAVEFLLNMDAHRVALTRQALQFRRTQLEAQWTVQVHRAGELADRASGSLQGIPARPASLWPPQVAPTLAVPVGDLWISIAERAKSNRHKLTLLVDQEIPRVEEITVSAQAELTSAESNAQDRQSLLSRLVDSLESEEQEAVRVKERITAIDEDIQRNKDVRTLKKLGSRVDSSVDRGACPVCHQDIADSLVPLPAEQAVMSLDDNIQFLTEQRRTFLAVQNNAERVVEARRLQVRTIREELQKLRENVRVIRQTLVSDGRLPSLAAIHSRIDLENSIKADTETQERLDNILSEFEALAAAWRSLETELAALPDEDTTLEDKEKIAAWTRSLQSQLTQYGFGSFDVTQATISADTYRPEHEGFDLQTSISASDLIRTIWSYLSGLLELARTTPTNHPGCIIFDEPKQQSARDVSFAALLKRSATAVDAKQQVIFFTSENQERLLGHLAGIPHTFKSIEDRVLKKL